MQTCADCNVDGVSVCSSSDLPSTSKQLELEWCFQKTQQLAQCIASVAYIWQKDETISQTFLLFGNFHCIATFKHQFKKQFSQRHNVLYTQETYSYLHIFKVVLKKQQQNCMATFIAGQEIVLRYSVTHLGNHFACSSAGSSPSSHSCKQPAQLKHCTLLPSPASKKFCTSKMVMYLILRLY